MRVNGRRASSDALTWEDDNKDEMARLSVCAVCRSRCVKLSATVGTSTEWLLSTRMPDQRWPSERLSEMVL